MNSTGGGGKQGEMKEGRAVFIGIMVNPSSSKFLSR